ncbi:MAG TPA: uL15 family ribosomal protein [Candidatus Sulfotelmatobacter sp.]|nr:uL15 family ribosomal protein [Candidatus Sulfotelmatobacter sp.]
MTTAKRKTRKLRASRCHGWGRSGQHRDSGMLGGHGNAGWKRHKWSAVIRYDLQMGSRGFHPVRQKITNAINVSDLVLQLDRLIEEGSAKQAGKMVEVDLGKAGYQKLLGNGMISQPLRIIVAKTSERAQEKIGRAGGEIVLPTKNKQD